MNDDRVPPRVHHRSPPPPAPEDSQVREAAQTLSRALNEGLTRIADSLDNALASSRITGRVMRELGARERERGVSNHLDGTSPTPASDIRLTHEGVTTWTDILMSESFEVIGQSPDLDDPGLDDALVRLAVTTVSWLKDRENRRAERDRERLSDLAEHGYDRTEGPQ